MLFGNSWDSIMSAAQAVSPDEPTTSTNETGRRKLPERPSTILVADDEHLVASGIAAHLTDLGHHVVGPASDGEEAILHCERAHPDMALLDIRMPKQDGLTAARIIYERFAIPVVILSAYSDPEYVGDASRLGVFGYLLKPVTQDQLRAAISVAWSRYVDASENQREISDLRQRLENRKLIEQAKWILVKRKGIDEPEAMRLLQRQARNNRRPLVEVAQAVLESEDLLSG
jgi:response regulator NasT